MMTQTTHVDHARLQEFAVEAARLMFDRHCEDVRLLDVRSLSQVCDYMLIGSGTSDRQMKSVASELEDLGKQLNQPAFRTNRDDAATWIVIDFIDLVAHLLEPSQRAYYELEQLWGDAEEVAWRRNDQKGLRRSASAEGTAGRGGPGGRGRQRGGGKS